MDGCFAFWCLAWTLVSLSEFLLFMLQGWQNQHHRQWESPTLSSVFSVTYDKRICHLAIVHKNQQVLVVSKLSCIIPSKEAAGHPRVLYFETVQNAARERWSNTEFHWSLKIDRTLIGMLMPSKQRYRDKILNTSQKLPWIFQKREDHQRIELSLYFITT